MKTLVTAALASLLCLTGCAAFAADLPGRKSLPPAPALPAFYDWTGFYVGGQVGYSWGANRMRELLAAGRVPLGLAFDDHAASAFGGGHVGFNYQMGQVVLGVEGDVDAIRTRSGLGDPGRLVRVQQDWQASVRARIGYAFDRVMIYGTGGAAFTSFDNSYNPVAGVGESEKLSRTGYTVGGGVNYAMTDKLILGLDYRYTDYGRFGYVGRSAFGGRIAEQEPSLHQVRASVAYKF